MCIYAKRTHIMMVRHNNIITIQRSACQLRTLCSLDKNTITHHKVKHTHDSTTDTWKLQKFGSFLCTHCVHNNIIRNLEQQTLYYSVQELLNLPVLVLKARHPGGSPNVHLLTFFLIVLSGELVDCMLLCCFSILHTVL